MKRIVWKAYHRKLSIIDEYIPSPLLRKTEPEFDLITVTPSKHNVLYNLYGLFVVFPHGATSDFSRVFIE